MDTIRYSECYRGVIDISMLLILTRVLNFSERLYLICNSYKTALYQVQPSLKPILKSAVNPVVNIFTLVWKGIERRV